MTNRLQAINVELKEITQVAQQQKVALGNIQRQRMQASELDDKVTLELNHAKNEIEQLRADLGNNIKRLHVNARCPTLPNATSATGEPDAAGARLNDSAERDYLSLRERIKMTNIMVEGLQNYIRHQCLK
ncbi:lysis protein [Obesumbacterium proteus]|uniref:Defective peptidase n=1 Tax=Obesumbacterium proteus ATCC 12841 TaxID=1354268 RepID=A0AA91EHP1_9GAMM|nr:lysis protein [Obesumbacterium proteus]OAT57981.1 putative defective peptidase [Obesumbacterium proteus ATCC 12841]